MLACLAIALSLSVWITLTSGSFNLSSTLFFLVLPWALLRMGRIITVALRLPSFFALDFLLGVAVVSVGVMVWKVLVPLSLWILVVVLLIAAVGIPRLLPQKQREPVSRLDLFCVIVSLVAATGWSQDLILPTSPVEGGIVFKPWSDFFFHASIVARSLGTQTLPQVGNYEWKGFPAIFYHYGSYSLASCLAKVVHLPAYDATVGFWAPFGSFLSGLASYALGRVFWSQSAGLAALIGAFLIPDAALLNIGHPTYSYFFHQHVAPGGLYGVAIAGAALILVLQGVREKRRMWIACGVIVCGLVAFFKVHVFAAAFPLVFSFAVLAWPSRTPLRWLVLGLSIVTGVALLPLANRFYGGMDVHVDLSGSAWYWKLLARLARGTPVESWYQIFSADHAFPSHLPQAIGLTLLNTFGVFAILTPLVWLLVLWRKTWQASEGISVAAAAILLLMTFCLGGDLRSGELIHRPFVWAYWLVGSLTAGRLFSILAEGRSHLATAAITAVGIALTLVPMRYGSGLQRGKWPGAAAYNDLRVDRGFLDCAHFIRDQPPVTALAQDSALDPHLILGALSERPSFAARLQMWKLASSFRASPYREQLQQLQSLERAANVPDLQRSVHETGIRWYVVHPSDSNVWPSEFLARPAFESRGYKVYDMRRCFDLRG